MTVPRLHAPVARGELRVQVTVELQTPGMDGGIGLALQFAVDPPLYPVHDHVQGPAPETPLGVPTLQRPRDGAVGSVCPFELPQTPGTGVSGVTPLHVALHFPGCPF